MDQVKECTYCSGTFPHQAPTGCNQPGPDIHWMLDDDANIVVERQEIDGVVAYFVQEQDGSISQHRQCVITQNSKGRYLFDGFNIETEEFMGFVGMIDAVVDSPNKKVKFTGDDAEDL